MVTIFQPYMAAAYRAIFRRREVVLLNNSYAGANDYSRWLAVPRDRFRVIHNGFEFPDISPKTRTERRKEYGIPEDAIVVGSVLRFGEEKRPELLMDITRIL